MLLNIPFGLTEEQVKKEVIKLVKNNDLTMEMDNYGNLSNYDTFYYKNLEINNSNYKCRVYFNDDRLQTGPLRNYTYSFTTQPFTKTGNDTAGIGVFNWNVFKASDLENLKSFLDKKYGAGVVYNKETSGNESTYKYITKYADLFLNYGEKEENNFRGIPIKIPFYTIANLEIKSKSYDIDFNTEYEKKRKLLKPEDVLTISFKAPYLSSGIDIFDNYIPKIILESNMEYYLTTVIDNDINECKGILSITDAYEDTLKKFKISYKFYSPLTSSIKQQVREMIYRSYSIERTDPSFEKISNLIKSGYTLKTYFKPTAVLLDNGDVIK